MGHHTNTGSNRSGHYFAIEYDGIDRATNYKMIRLTRITEIMVPHEFDLDATFVKHYDNATEL